MAFTANDGEKAAEKNRRIFSALASKKRTWGALRVDTHDYEVTHMAKRFKRLPSPKPEPKVVVQAKVGAETVRRMDELARRERRTRSQVVDMACEKYVSGIRST